MAMLICFSLSGCQSGETIRVLHAGSLSVPFKELARMYEKEHPGIKIQMEGHGSLACVRKITDLKQPCDVLAVADYALIDELMIPGFADYNIRFAGNELAIGYVKGSAWEQMLTQENWFEFVLHDSVSYGRADPDHDPVGYRTVLMTVLSEKKYEISGFHDAFVRKNRRFIRPKGTELLPLLETGAIDLVFHYRSVLVQHNLGYLTLSDSLNLSNPGLNEWYQKACMDVRGTEQGQRLTKCGEAMVYGMTVPFTSQHPSGGEHFLRFILEKGQRVLDSLGQPPLKPIVSEGSLLTPEWMETKPK